MSHMLFWMGGKTFPENVNKTMELTPKAVLKGNQSYSPLHQEVGYVKSGMMVIASKNYAYL